MSDRKGDFAGGGPKGAKGFPMNDAKHQRLAIGGATRSYNAGNISKAKENSIKAEARHKLGISGGKTVKKHDQHPAAEAPKHISPPKASPPAGGMSHAQFESLNHGVHDHMAGRKLKPFEKTGK